MKYNVIRTVIFRSTYKNIFIFLYTSEKIKFLLNAYQKRGLYLEELSHWTITKKIANKKSLRHLAERPHKRFSKMEIIIIQKEKEKKYFFL